MAGPAVPTGPQSARSARDVRLGRLGRVAAATPAGGPLKPGDRLADRYVLIERVATGGPADLWRARDDVLARDVAVKCVATPNKGAREAAEPFLDAAVRTGAVNHPGLVRVYDAALEARPGRGNDVAYVLSEWVDGEPLDVHLARIDGLAAPDAADVLRQAADALTATHAAGLAHGRLHPRNVLLAPSGRVRITDVEVAAALHGEGTVGQITASEIAADTRDLAAVLYALVTVRWPVAATPQQPDGLGAAPVEAGRVRSPRQLRAGVPRSLESVIMRALDPTRAIGPGALRTPAALADAADAAATEIRVEEQAKEQKKRQPQRRGIIRKTIPWLLALVVIGAVGVAGRILGLAVGDLPSRDGGQDAVVSTVTAPTRGVPAFPIIPIGPGSKVVIKDFDPEGRDHEENPDQVQNAVDGDITTAWTTSIYKTAEFSGLKQGVGLLLDFGKPRSLHSALVQFSAKGAQVQLYVSDTRPIAVSSMTLVSADTKGDQNALLRPLNGVATARYAVIWITKLPKSGSGYQVGISELRFT